MKELAIDCRMINMSGIGTYLKHIIPGIIKSGEFKITCLGYEELKTFDWFDNVEYIMLKSKILSIYEQIELSIKIPSCDIFWSPNWNSTGLPIRAKLRITTIHDVYHLAFPQHFSKIKILFLKLFMKRVINLSSRIITVSNFSKLEIHRLAGCPLEKISVVPLAVADDFDKNYIFSSIPDKFILYVGNVKPHKNLYNLLCAFNEIKDKNAYLYVVGQREGFISGTGDTLLELISNNDKIIFTGKVDDQSLKNYYANASLFVFPSKYEGFGLPILEAMKFNLPVIASNAASIPEVAGNLVDYFDPDEPGQMIKAIDNFFDSVQIANDNRYTEHLRKFDWQNTIRDHILILLNIDESTSNS